MGRRKFTDETLNRAAEMRELGCTYAAIGRELGMSNESVYWHCLRLGADSPRTTAKRSVGPVVVKRGNHQVRRFSAEEDAKIVEMSVNGMGASKTAQALGRKPNSITVRLLTLARRDARNEAEELLADEPNTSGGAG